MCATTVFYNVWWLNASDVGKEFEIYGKVGPLWLVIDILLRSTYRPVCGRWHCYYAGMGTLTTHQLHGASPLGYVPSWIYIVTSRSLDHMVENELLESFQSVYRAGHNTETALLRVHNDIVNAVDHTKGVFLVLLDFSLCIHVCMYYCFVSHCVSYVCIKFYVCVNSPKYV